jgi:hypothetical protein
MSSAASQQQADWLVENGPRELESILRAIVYHPSTPILMADDERRSLRRKPRRRKTARRYPAKRSLGIV